jgi:predicted MFS family arabinose efflux permease
VHGTIRALQGAIATATGFNWSSSMLLAGLIVEDAGYQAAFLSLAAVATVALLIFWTLMPKTKPAATGSGEETPSILHSAAA